MAFRSEARIVAVLMMTAATGAAQQPVTFEVKHNHFPKWGEGTLSIGDTGIAYTEPKKMSHSRSWVWESIQQLTLERGSIRLLTYEDEKLALGRDREFSFSALPSDAAGQLLTTLRMHLGTRLIAALADTRGSLDYGIAAKLLKGRKGTEGVLRFSAGMIMFDTDEGHDSRMWTAEDIETLAHPSPDELSVTVRERGGLRRLSTREFRFQLKEPMLEARYQALWRSMNRLRIGAPPASLEGGFTMPGHVPQEKKQ